MGASLRKILYPAIIFLSKLFKKNLGIVSGNNNAPVSFYSLSAILNNGEVFSFAQLRGKKVLIVNTASGCGYTGQFSELQQLYELYNSKIEILAFPSNDFKEQEKLPDTEIANFCKANFNLGFPLMKKTVVVKFTGQDDVYEWLSNPLKNGWNDKAPTWNFCKYLINEEGNLTHFFEAAISPIGKEIKTLLNS